MFFVPQVSFIGVALACDIAFGGRVVLYDNVVPVGHPDRPIWANFGHDRGHPFVVAGKKVPAVSTCVGGSKWFEQKGGRQVAGRFGHKCGPVPIFAWVLAGCIKRVTGGGCKLAVVIHLTDLFGDRIHPCRLRNHGKNFAGIAPDLLIEPVRDRHVYRWVIVGCGAEQDALLADPNAPRVVRRVAEEFQLRAVRLEPIKAGAEFHGLAANFTFETGIAEDPINPVIQPIVQVRRPCVRVAGAPTAE